MAFELIIFDCDGVLVDNEVISCRAHARTLTRHNYPITAEQVLDRFLGVSDRTARRIIERELGRKLPCDFEQQVQQARRQHYAGGLRAISHVGEAISAIGLPKCVASRHVGKDPPWPRLRGAFFGNLRRIFFRQPR